MWDLAAVHANSWDDAEIWQTNKDEIDAKVDTEMDVQMGAVDVQMGEAEVEEPMQKT